MVPRLKYKGSRTKTIIAEVPMRSGFTPILLVASLLFRGRGYVLVVNESCGDANGRKPPGFFSAVRNRWLCKYAIKVTVNTLELKTAMTKEFAGLDIPIVLVGQDTVIG